MIVLKINKYFYICFIAPIARNKQYCSVTGQEGKGRSGFPDRPVVGVHLNTFLGPAISDEFKSTVYWGICYLPHSLKPSLKLGVY